MQSRGTVFCLLLLLLAVGAFPQNTIINPPEYDTVLYNPGCGVETFGSSDGGLPAAQYPKSTVYYDRFYWKDIEPQRGNIKFNLFDSRLSNAAQHGQRFAFRIMCVDNGMMVPQWLADSAGGAYYGGVYWPDWNNPKFMDEVQRLMTALGARYDKNPNLDHIDESFLGCWGEQNSSCVSGNPPLWTSATAERNMDILLAAFPDVPIVTLYAYHIRPGLGWRNDCFGDISWGQDAWVQNTIVNVHPDSWKTGMVCQEVCYTIGQWDSIYHYDLAGFQGVMNKALAWHVSSINAKMSPIPANWMPALIETIKYLGYRFKLTQMEHTALLAPGQKLFLRMKFENEGVAPPYHAYPLMLKLEPAGGGTSQIFPTASDTIVKTWIPGVYTVQDSVALPGNMKPGLYALKIAFCYPDSNRPAIKLANYGKDSAGWYAFSTVTVGNVSVVKATAYTGKFSGLQVSCNPFNRHTVIQFILPQDCILALNVYNAKGKLIRGLGQVSGTPGPGRVQWDGADGSGVPVPVGAYLIRATVNGSTNGVKRIFLAQ